jgi:hypothetical protein
MNNSIQDLISVYNRMPDFFTTENIAKLEVLIANNVIQDLSFEQLDATPVHNVQDTIPNLRIMTQHLSYL